MSNGDEGQIVQLSSQPVELYKILKFEGLVESGAQSKLFIDDGQVKVNGIVETRRRRKIVHGDQVEFDGLRMSVVCESSPSP